MKIIALVRTLNEENNIQRFCGRYSEFCDEIIVSDSGSTDETIKLAREFPKVVIDEYNSLFNRIFTGKNEFYTKQPNHINHLISLAKKHEADWIIYSDCDLVPTYQLINSAREMMQESDVKQIKCKQYHIYGYYRYFPEMTTGWASWAFRSDLELYCDESDPRQMNMRGGIDENDPAVRKPDHPKVLLHYFAQTEKDIKRKMLYYDKMHRHHAHPKDRCGRLSLIPEEII
ncbi:MAG: glycosyltransferase family 2 protein [Saprospiraceae bacterium]|nr:glycosyltransferase family 2 protein [Saprospiraceae bacterium]